MDSVTISTQTHDPHTVIDPAILYFGTPVVLVTSVNPDGSSNIMPMSSAFWLGQTGVLGIGARSQTAANLQRNLGCVLNLPSVDLVTAGRPARPDDRAARRATGQGRARLSRTSRTSSLERA